MANSHEVSAPNYGTGRKTIGSYLTGLVLSLVFTIAAFDLVINHSFSGFSALLLLSGLAVAQLIAQVIFFLRLNTESTEGKWNTMPFLFVIVIVAILVVGTLWIMYNLDYNMMH